MVFSFLLLPFILHAVGGMAGLREHVPVDMLSLVAPGVMSSGIVGCAAAVITGVCAYKTGNVFLSMLLGMATVAIARHVS